MKMIHCADLHLGSRMESGLPAEKAKERRLELLHTFVRMTERAAEDGVESILICGDLFDGKTVSARVCNCVLDAVVQHPQITFYCLQGNHDQGGFFGKTYPVFRIISELSGRTGHFMNREMRL